MNQLSILAFIQLNYRKQKKKKKKIKYFPMNFATIFLPTWVKFFAMV